MTKRYTILTRCLAALALMFVYVFSTSAILVGASTTSAEARGGRGGGRGGGFGRGGGRGFGRGGGRGFGRGGRGWGRGYGRGWGRGYGYGGVYIGGPRCWWNDYGVRVCRYY